MTYFFDHNTARPVVRALRELGADVKHLSEVYAVDTPDTDWIPDIASRGWVLVTADAAIRHKPPERVALESTGLIALFLPKRFHSQDRWAQARWFIRFWPKITQQVENPTRRWKTAQLTANGKVEPFL